MRWVVTVLGALIPVSIAPAGAQTAVPELPGPNVLASNDVGFGGYEVSGRSVQVFRIPFSYSLRDSVDQQWGARLTFPVSFGFHDLRVADVPGDEVREKLDTYTIAPGIELQVPLRNEWMLKPYGEVGSTRDLDSDENVLLYSLGLSARRDFARRSWTMAFGSAVEYSATKNNPFEGSELPTVEVGLEGRHSVGFRVGGNPADIGMFAIVRRFLTDLEFRRPDLPNLKIDDQYEVGLTFGTEPQPTLWGMALPRIGVSYRFGDGFEALRINFGFPF